MLRLNLGSGQRPFGDGWTNVDISDKYKPDVVADCSHLPMFHDGSAEMIVCHHTLEHYGCNEGTAMLQECFRILAPDGSLIVCVPEMRALAKAWIRGDMDTQLFMTNTYGAYHGEEPDRHRWGYDGLSLAAYLMSIAPWSKVKTFDNRKIEGAGIVADWWILGIEAVK